MKRLAAKILLFLLSAALVFPSASVSGSEIAFALIAFAVALLPEIRDLKPTLRHAYLALLVLLAVFVPALRPFAPLFLFECELWDRDPDLKNWPHFWESLVFLACWLLVFIIEGPLRAPIFYLLLPLAPFLEGLCYRASSQEQQLLKSRDYYEGKLIEREQDTRRAEQLASEKRELARLEERERLARELHDVTGHSLSSAILQVGALQVMAKNSHQTEILAHPLETLQESLEKGLSDVRSTLHALQAESLDLESEFRRLLTSAEGFQHSFSYDARLPLSRELRLDLLAIAREAVTNAIRHSRGTSLELKFRASGSIIALEIRDNGQGLHPKGRLVQHGLGLENLQRAADRQGGVLDLHSEEGKGLTVRFTIILSAPQ